MSLVDDNLAKFVSGMVSIRQTRALYVIGALRDSNRRVVTLLLGHGCCRFCSFLCFPG